MNNNKLTDAEVKKALEICSKSTNGCSHSNYTCEDCYLNGQPICSAVLLQDTIDLINRQEEEIKEYEKVVGKLGRKDGKVVCVLKGKETEYIPMNIANVYKKLAISKAKAEAYKECLDELARRLGYAFLSKHSCVLDIMENLLNELVGDSNG